MTPLVEGKIIMTWLEQKNNVNVDLGLFVQVSLLSEAASKRETEGRAARDGAATGLILSTGAGQHACCNL